ncbi:hypothetical protein H6P81_017326 [Aristolochia fimbriata]|uniref:TF-B3 domain-containing protein n=1 Tax=Aristolochia fimbriata TaxID=158543 RepID=A0AAV7DY20_ARIFI|nr:hypothetical protein H6P81_017326 [Aristolochia fimbriata]
MAPGSPLCEQQRMPAFFKVMVGDFQKRVKIPTEFIRRIRRKLPSKTIFSGKSKDDFFFQNGWSKFVEDYSLEIGDFVVFQSDDKLNFDVTVLGHNQCEKKVTNTKKIPPKAKNTKQRTAKPSSPLCNCKYIPENGRLVFDAESCPYKLTNPHFVFLLIPFFLGRIRIPKTFGRESGLWPGFGNRASMTDPRGRSWPVSLGLLCKTTGRGGFATGWSKVVEENGLAGGDVCVFEVTRAGGPRKPSLVSLHIPRQGGLMK